MNIDDSTRTLKRYRKSCEKWQVTISIFTGHSRALTDVDILLRKMHKVKVGFSPSKKKCFICFNGSSIKIIKNTSDFILKAFSLSTYLIFSLDFLLYVKKASWLKDEVNFRM